MFALFVTTIGISLALTFIGVSIEYVLWQSVPKRKVNYYYYIERA